MEDGRGGENDVQMQLLPHNAMSWPRFSGTFKILNEIDLDQISPESLLGQGEFGSFYKATFRDRSVAVKIVAKEHHRYWLKELQIYRSLDPGHPNVSRLICSDVDRRLENDHKYWTVFNFYDLGPLDVYMKTYHLEERQLVQMALAIASGLQFIHEPISAFGKMYRYKPAIYHGDVRPGNIFLTGDLVPVIAGFGMAKPKLERRRGNDASCEETYQLERLTTFRYLAPEILRCQSEQEVAQLPFDTFQMSDVFALGFVLWEMTRRTKFQRHIRSYKMPWSIPLRKYSMVFEDVAPEAQREEMQTLIVDQEKRPELPVEWRSNPIATRMEELMTSCWSSSTQERPSSAQIHQQLLLLSKSQEK